MARPQSFVDIPPDRYRAIMWEETEDLSEQELACGWHFCAEFDGLLIGPHMAEWECCECFEQPESGSAAIAVAIGVATAVLIFML